MPEEQQHRWRVKVSWANGSTEEWEFDGKPKRAQSPDGVVLTYETADGDERVEVVAQHVHAIHLRELAE